MLPDAYWKLLWHWWWLIGTLFLLGAGGAYYISKVVVAYESNAALEITRVFDANGNLSYDEFARRTQANLWAEQLRGSWVTSRLMDELRAGGVDTSALRKLSLEITAPSRTQISVGPAIIEISVQYPGPATAQKIAEAASKVYADYITERQETCLNQRLQEVGAQVAQFEEDLRGVLNLKRDALKLEATKVQEASQTILETNERLLGQLPVLLDDFRRQIGLANVGLNAGTEGIDIATGNLRAQIEALQSQWQTELRPSLTVLFAAEAQPEYRLSVIQEKPIQDKYEEALRTLSTLSGNINPDVVAVLETGTSAGRVSAIGLRPRIVLVGGGVVGLIAGWILANLGEYLLLARARRKAAAEQHQADTPTDAPEEEPIIEERQMSPV